MCCYICAPLPVLSTCTISSPGCAVPLLSLCVFSLVPLAPLCTKNHPLHSAVHCIYRSRVFVTISPSDHQRCCSPQLLQSPATTCQCKYLSPMWPILLQPILVLLLLLHCCSPCSPKAPLQPHANAARWASMWHILPAPYPAAAAAAVIRFLLTLHPYSLCPTTHHASLGTCIHVANPAAADATSLQTLQP